MWYSLYKHGLFIIEVLGLLHKKVVIKRIKLGKSNATCVFANQDRAFRDMRLTIWLAFDFNFEVLCLLHKKFWSKVSQKMKTKLGISKSELRIQRHVFDYMACFWLQLWSPGTCCIKKLWSNVSQKIKRNLHICQSELRIHRHVFDYLTSFWLQLLCNNVLMKYELGYRMQIV